MVGIYTLKYTWYLVVLTFAIIYLKSTHAIELRTNSMRLGGKASLPSGAPSIVLLPAGGPAGEPFASFGAIV